MNALERGEVLSGGNTLRLRTPREDGVHPGPVARARRCLACLAAVLGLAALGTHPVIAAASSAQATPRMGVAASPTVAPLPPKHDGMGRDPGSRTRDRAVLRPPKHATEDRMVHDRVASDAIAR